MYSDDTYSGLPLTTSSSGHVLPLGNPLSQVTVNPADLYLVPPSHGPTYSHLFPHIGAASPAPIFDGYATFIDAPQAVPPIDPLKQTTQPMSDFHASNGVPPRQFTRNIGPLRGTSRGSSTVCKWVLEGLPACGQAITEGDVPKHLAGHGIRRMCKDCDVRCCWQGCTAHIKRGGVVRHVREVHMGSKRKPHKHLFSRRFPALDRSLERNCRFF